ncbi:hypothetical protein LTR36_004832 [Oleoguttula mirabilis]|uniref:Uncharacterized protein n=1 Tax=Oleoguttula mirabilis TaxID=1507867 RepID=A0AAV9JFZ9_9PEZI|nr:hypothetical protein LTR36_004832 [Oleoguttula mirabilis]
MHASFDRSGLDNSGGTASGYEHDWSAQEHAASINQSSTGEVGRLIGPYLRSHKPSFQDGQIVVREMIRGMGHKTAVTVHGRERGSLGTGTATVDEHDESTLEHRADANGLSDTGFDKVLEPSGDDSAAALNGDVTILQ